MKITNKILSMILALVMVLGLLPATAFATGAEEDVIYLSISLDSGYIDDKNGEPIAYVPVPLSKIEEIDLTQYGLDNMLYDADSDGECRVLQGLLPGVWLHTLRVFEVLSGQAALQDRPYQGGTHDRNT